MSYIYPIDMYFKRFSSKKVGIFFKNMPTLSTVCELSITRALFSFNYMKIDIINTQLKFTQKNK